ncbi:hypothetical protein FE257_000861 [Aspergillus nanangensis]|uniref:RGS domain-containing protein n=1 Tax=Aspergillus nanangensis TaxID=2582783 RepID=A0AAD4GPY0_ASPNN|nr:hypothetical protein FE257_000861 [Aspergillus nanangensis]
MATAPSTAKLHHLHPHLDDILDDVAPFPYTLAAFIGFLDEAHSLENAEFLLESKRYCRLYQWLKASGESEATSGAGAHLWEIWSRLTDRYIQHGAPREINIPDEIRQELVDYQHSHEDHPPPSILDPPIRHVEDLLHGCVLTPFFKACSVNSRIHAHSTPNLVEVVPRPPTTSDSAAEHPRVRKKSKKHLSHHAGIQELGQFITGAVTGVEPISSLQMIDEGRGRRSWDELLSQEMAHSTLGEGIARPMTAPPRQPRRGWGLLNRIFDK